MTDKQPEIYKFLQEQFKETRDYNDKKFAELFDKFNELHVEVEKIKDKEKPSAACRDLIIELQGISDEKCRVVKLDIDNVSKAVRRRVSWGVFWMITGAAFVFTVGSYVYTWNTNNRIDAVIIQERKDK